MRVLSVIVLAVKDSSEVNIGGSCNPVSVSASIFRNTERRNKVKVVQCIGLCIEIPRGHVCEREIPGVGCTSSARYRSYRRFISLEGITGGWLTRSFQLVRDITETVFRPFSILSRAAEE